MVRTLDPLAHSVRRETFLDAAQRLMQAKGYERMSIQEVIEDVGASKGAFYHYFGSKSALLEAVVDRMVEDATGSVAPRVTDASVPALSRLDALFTGIATWKGERTELLLAVMEVWFADDNAIAREKFRQGVVAPPDPAARRDHRARQAGRHLHRDLPRPRGAGGGLPPDEPQRGGHRSLLRAQGRTHHVRGRPGLVRGLRRSHRADPRPHAGHLPRRRPGDPPPMVRLTFDPQGSTA